MLTESLGFFLNNPAKFIIYIKENVGNRSYREYINKGNIGNRSYRESR